jgi:tRNA A37 methylthiotransferase MiaB
MNQHDLLHIPIQHLHDCSLRILRRCYAAEQSEHPRVGQGRAGHIETQCSIDVPHFLEEQKNSRAQRIVNAREA